MRHDYQQQTTREILIVAIAEKEEQERCHRHVMMGKITWFGGGRSR